MGQALQKIPTADDFVDIWESASDESFAQTAGQAGKIAKLAGALLGLLLLLAFFLPIAGAVIAPGEVGVESRNKRISHPAGGVIERIAVENGQRVDRGDLLLKLKDTVSSTRADYSTMSVEQLLAQKGRLEAERLGTGNIRFPAELASAGTPGAAQAMADERQLFSIRRAEDAQRRAQLGARVEQFSQQISGYRSQIASVERQRTLIQPELAGVRELWEKELVTINRLNELERTSANLEGSIASLQADIAQAMARISETQEQLLLISQTRRAEAATELARINSLLNDQIVRSVSATDERESSEIRSPYEGVVEKLAFVATGDVIRGAETIMEIVPDEELMIVEAKVSSADIDQVAVGQEARIRFSSFSFSGTPEIRGTVQYVATDREIDEVTGVHFYPVRVAVSQEQVSKENLVLRSGMPAEVYVRTGERSLMSVLTRPIANQFRRAFRQD